MGSIRHVLLKDSVQCKQNVSVHMMIYGKQGHAIGLWNRPAYDAQEFDLEALQYCEEPFKWCPLERVLDLLNCQVQK
ncbi:MAG: hypothetical protein ACSNEK_00795 [Parachlamydiaceae bacterium]